VAIDDERPFAQTLRWTAAALTIAPPEVHVRREQTLPIGVTLCRSRNAAAPMLLVGLPLFLWRDHRAASALVLLFHVLAYGILDGSLKRILSSAERVLLALLYWLNPWQLYFAAFLWNPNYLYLFGAVHLWSALAQRERARFWPSLLHAAGLVLAFQIHASCVLLAAASVLLALRRYFRVHWTGALLGGSIAAIPLVRCSSYVACTTRCRVSAAVSLRAPSVYFLI